MEAGSEVTRPAVPLVLWLFEVIGRVGEVEKELNADKEDKGSVPPENNQYGILLAIRPVKPQVFVFFNQNIISLKKSRMKVRVQISLSRVFLINLF